MSIHVAYDVYIASPLFSAAERAFNDLIAATLRAQGQTIFLPQELWSNHSISPTEREIFEGDTIRLLQSRVLLAVIDGEATDVGVATEIGIALTHSIPVVGLWTDIRQRRIGSGRMYRNIYLTGAIRQNGVIADSVEQAAQHCKEYLSGEPQFFGDEAARVVESFVARASALADVSEVLRRSYREPFDSDRVVLELIRQCVDSRCPSVLDFGSGDGRLGSLIAGCLPDAKYVPIDLAKESGRGVAARYDHNATQGAFDAVSVAFVLHDYADKTGLLASLLPLLETKGRIVVLDLEASDLPRLCAHFERAVVRFRATRTDLRLTAGSLQLAAEGAGLVASSIGIHSVPFAFNDPQDLMTYVRAYSIDCGFDLGLPRHYAGDLLQAIAVGARDLSYPFRDTRNFIFAVLERPA